MSLFSRRGIDLRVYLLLVLLCAIGVVVTLIPFPELMALTVLIGATVSLFVMSSPTMTLQPYSFGVLSILYIAFVGGLQPLYRLTQNEGYFFDHDVLPLLARGSSITAVSLLGFTVGYVTFAPRLHSKARTLQRLPDPKRFALAMGIVGLALYSAWLALSGSGWSTGLKLLGDETLAARGTGPSIGYLYLGLDVIMAAAVFAVAWASFQKKKARVALILGISLTTFALFGFRYRLMILVIAAVALIRGAHMYRIKFRHMLAVAAFASVAFTIIGIYRAPAEIQRNVTYRSSAVGSFDLSGALALAVHEVPAKRPYLLGRSYTPILTQWVPSVLWDDKPRPATIDLLADLTAEGAGSAIPFWGEIYVNFGWIGAMLGMLAVGAVCRRLDYRLMEAHDWFSLSMLGIGVGFTIHLLSRGNLANQISVAAVLFGVPWFAVKIWRRMGRPKGARSTLRFEHGMQRASVEH